MLAWPGAKIPFHSKLEGSEWQLIDPFLFFPAKKENPSSFLMKMNVTLSHLVMTLIMSPLFFLKKKVDTARLCQSLSIHQLDVFTTCVSWMCFSFYLFVSSTEGLHSRMRACIKMIKSKRRKSFKSFKHGIACIRNLYILCAMVPAALPHATTPPTLCGGVVGGGDCLFPDMLHGNRVSSGLQLRYESGSSPM